MTDIKAHTRVSFESIAILRRMTLLHYCCWQLGTRKCITKYLHGVNLSVSERQIDRDISAMKQFFGLVRKESGNGSIYFSYWPDDDWLERLVADRVGSESAVGLAGDGVPEAAVQLTEREQREDCDLGEKMIRILAVVEMLPVDDTDVQGISVGQIGSVLSRKGMIVSRRTVQRDLKFIREHFLVLECSGKGREKLWKRMEYGDWTDNFAPRFPRFVPEEVHIIARFLYGRDALSAGRPATPEAWIRSVKQLHL